VCVSACLSACVCAFVCECIRLSGRSHPAIRVCLRLCASCIHAHTCVRVVGRMGRVACTFAVRAACFSVVRVSAITAASGYFFLKARAGEEFNIIVLYVWRDAIKSAYTQAHIRKHACKERSIQGKKSSSTPLCAAQSAFLPVNQCLRECVRNLHVCA